MKHLVPTVTIVLLALLASCSDDEPAVVPSNHDTYFGRIGSQRWYKITELWFHQGTEVPFITVPDSLRARVALSDSQLAAGVSVIHPVLESITSLGSSYSNWQLPLPLSMYKSVGEYQGYRYELLDELQALSEGIPYSPRISGVSYGAVLLELPDADWSVGPTADQRQHPSMPYLSKPLVVGNSWSRWRQIDTSSGQPSEDMICRVVARETVTVSAGTFDAYKLEISSQWYNPSHGRIDWYEYYVPNVGLILRESDDNVCRWNSGTGGTICFRQVMRMELVSYNLIR